MRVCQKDKSDGQYYVQWCGGQYGIDQDGGTPAEEWSEDILNRLDAGEFISVDCEPTNYGDEFRVLLPSRLTPNDQLLRKVAKALGEIRDIAEGGGGCSHEDALKGALDDIVAEVDKIMPLLTSEKS